jgi:branched-chain amino acid transport system substrate-binding protein
MTNLDKRKLTLAISIFVLIVLVGGLFYLGMDGNSVKENKIKIGVVAPLSGKSSDWGQRTQRGINLALSEFKNSKLEVIYEDSASETEKAVTAANKLIEVDQVDVLFCQLSGDCSAIAPIAQRKGIVLIGFTSTPGFTKTGDYIFSIRGDSIYLGQDIGSFVNERYSKAAVFNLNNPTMTGAYQGFQKTFKKEIVFSSSHDDKTIDFKTELTKAKEKNPDVLVFISRYQSVSLLVKQARELGMNQQIISVQGIDTRSFLESTGNLSEGILYGTAMVYEDTKNPELQKALVKYKELYQESMPLYSAEGYDATRLLNSVVNKGASNSEEIRDQFFKVKAFPGLSGSITFDETGLVLKEYHMFIIREGKFVRYN